MFGGDIINKWQKEVQKSLLDSESQAVNELKKQYKRALNDINEKIRLFQANIEILDEAITAEGIDEVTKKALLSQKRSKVYQLSYQEALKGQVSGILDKMHSDQYATIDSYLHSCYETGYIGTMYDIAQQGVPIIQPINQAAVTKAILTDSKIVEGYYKRLGISTAKLKKTITHEISRGIASGLRYGEIARNIDNASKSGFYNAYRIARTEGHRIQQSAAYDAQTAIKDKGIDILRQWDAVLDGRTRPSHRMLDGQIVGVDEDFEIDGKKVKKPGDFGRAEEDINCRCIVTTRIPEDLDEEELETLKKRAEFFGLDKTKQFDDFREKYLEASKMAAESERKNDWSKTVSRKISETEKRDVISYAKNNGIEIGDISGFDGDPNLLKAEIKTISNICNEYGLKATITVGAEVFEDDADFAITAGNNIIFNSKALRDRTITESNIRNGGYFASQILEDIALHEIGHILERNINVHGVAISKKAYYNVYGKYISPSQMKKKLVNLVSRYSSLESTEIIAESIVANKNHPNEFTNEVIRLLKGLLPHEKT